MKISGKYSSPGAGIAAYKKEAEEAVSQKKKEAQVINKQQDDAVSVSLSSSPRPTELTADAELSKVDRADKLAKLKNQVLSGNYPLSSERVAQSIVNFFSA